MSCFSAAERLGVSVSKALRAVMTGPMLASSVAAVSAGRNAWIACHTARPSAFLSALRSTLRTVCATVARFLAMSVMQ